MTDASSAGVRRRWWHGGSLVLFIVVVRFLPALTSPAAASDDCERVRRSDAAGMERCLALRPDDVELMIDLADGYRQAGDRDRAEDLYRRALAVDPGDGELRRRLDALPPRRAGGV